MKAPSHTFDAGPPCAWTILAGGHVAQVAGTSVMACQRCEVRSAPIATVTEMVAFLGAHAGPVCGVAAKASNKSRRAA